MIDRYELRGMKRQVSNTADCQDFHICVACNGQFNLSVLLLFRFTYLSVTVSVLLYAFYGT